MKKTDGAVDRDVDVDVESRNQVATSRNDMDDDVGVVRDDDAGGDVAR